MSSEHQLKNSTQTIAYLWLLPVVSFTTAVWFTKNSHAIFIAHSFQLLCCLFLFFVSGYIFSLMKRTSLVSFKPLMLFFALSSTLIALISIFMSLFINPAWGMGLMLFGILILNKYPIPIKFNHKFPAWYSGLINRIIVMLCICIMVMLAYWLNPYSEPIKLYKL